MEQNVKYLDDKQLQELATEVQRELVARERKRKKEVGARIKALANEAGLQVTITDKVKKRRGRPPKKAVPQSTS